MNRGKLALQLTLVLVACVAGYAVAFHWIEHRRVVRGPWIVNFTSTTNVVTITANQSVLGITNVQIRLPNASSAGNVSQRIEFSQARQVPFEVPFGQCVFLDTTFLPGTVALELFGHQIQFMPRALTIDKVEHPWHNGETIDLN